MMQNKDIHSKIVKMCLLAYSYRGMELNLMQRAKVFAIENNVESQEFVDCLREVGYTVIMEEHRFIILGTNLDEFKFEIEEF